MPSMQRDASYEDGSVGRLTRVSRDCDLISETVHVLQSGEPREPAFKSTFRA